jgi:hypothetical protein
VPDLLPFVHQDAQKLVKHGTGEAGVVRSRRECGAVKVSTALSSKEVG